VQELNQMKKETFLTAVVAFLLLTGSGSPSAEADDLGLILPMPGQKQMNKASESANVKPAQPARPTTGGKKPQGSEVIISLPATIKPRRLRHKTTVLRSLPLTLLRSKKSR